MALQPKEEKTAEDRPEPMETLPSEALASAEETFSEEAQCRRRFLWGMLLGALLAFFFILLVFGVPRLYRTLTGRGNPGASVLTSAYTKTKLAEIQDIIEEYYLYEVDGQFLQDYLFRGVAAGLDDVYASYYTAEELSSVIDSIRGEYYGIGVDIVADEETGAFYIYQVYEDSPAQESGLLPGDVLRAVNGEPVDDLTLSDLVSLIRSQETFVMTVSRADTGEEVELTVTCGDVAQKYVTYEMMENGTAYLLLTEFTESAVAQFQEAAADLNGQGMKALIVDVRGNPGGMLTSVCDILDEILPGGLIVYTEDKNGRREEHTADEERSVTCEVAVLVDGNSASAAEIFAGAIQDYGIGPVIGTQTYGKGVVQKTYTFSDGSAFKMTVENYYTPNGQEIDGNGITPDIVVEDEGSDENDAVLARALQELKG